MSRDQIEFLVSRSIDGDLTAHERSQLDAALLADPSLADLQAEFSRVDDVLRNILPAVEFNEEMLCQSIMTGIEGPLADQIQHEDDAPLLRIRPWWNHAAVRYAAAVAIAATVAIAVWPSGSSTPTPSATPLPEVEVVVNTTPLQTLTLDKTEPAAPVTEVVVSAPPAPARPAMVEAGAPSPDLVRETPVVSFAAEEPAPKKPVR